MPAVSEKQARFMRMVKARQHGHAVGGPAVGKAARSMKTSDVEDFMHTGAEMRQMMNRSTKGSPAYTDAELRQGYRICY